MSKYSAVPEVFSEHEVQKVIFERWLQNTKGIVANKDTIKQYLKNEKLQNEFHLIYTYLIDYKKLKIGAIANGTWDYSKPEFNKLLEYASANQISNNPNISREVFTAIVKSCVDAGRSLVEPGKNNQRPIELALNKGNIHFIAALKENDYSFEIPDHNGFSPIVTLIGNIKKDNLNIEHLKLWINAGLPINTPCADSQNYCTALDMANDYKLDEVVNLLKKNGAVSSMAESWGDDIHNIDELYKAWGKYYEKSGVYDFTLELKIKYPKPHEKISEFKKYFKALSNLIKFIDFVKESPEFDSFIVDQFESLTTEFRKILNHHADNTSMIITPKPCAKDTVVTDYSAFSSASASSVIAEKQAVDEVAAAGGDAGDSSGVEPFNMWFS